MKLETRFNDWKRKLLDLGKRNSLINFKPDSKSVLRLSRPSSAELWQTVVEDEKELEFPYVNDPDEEEDILDQPEDFPYGSVYTNRRPQDAQKTLRNLRKRYKTFVEEQDVNVLYLSFGFLEWQEGDSSKKTLISPLILVPVSLQCASIKSPMVLKITDDEIVVNPTLAYKLSHDFGVELPEFQEDNFEAVYACLKEFAAVNKWIFRDQVALSILSFLKINMYKDLESHKDSILDHSLIKALGGQLEPLEREVQEQRLSDIDGFDHDAVKPTEVFNVVDADSSQLDAILCASRGVSFILQGPPGTGKSQTITNIIASKIADGKRVLFVSEKKAALDVVYNRLREAGLSDFCLTLHSNKANKKETLTQLETVLNLSRNKANVSDAVNYKLDKLMEDRKQLNQYAKEVNEVISPLNKSIFYANGKISEYSQYEDLPFKIPEVRQTTEGHFREYISALGSVAASIKRMKDDCSSNPWRNTSLEYMTNEFIQEFSFQKDKLLEGLASFISLCQTVKERNGLRVDFTLEGTEKLLELLSVAKESPVIPVGWIDDAGLERLKDLMEKEASRQREYSSLVKILLESIKTYKELNSSCSFQVEDIESSTEAEDLSRALDEVIASNNTFTVLKNDVSKLGFVAQNEALVKEYLALNGEICQSYNEDIFALDAKELELRFKYKYSSFFRIFKSAYWSDKKLLQQMAHNPKTKLKVSDIVKLMGKILRRNELFDLVKEQTPQMLAIFPLYYKNLNTDFELINRELAKFVEIRKLQDIALQIKSFLLGFEKKEGELKDFIKDRFQGIRTDWQEISAAARWIEAFRKALTDYDPSLMLMDNFVVSTCSQKGYTDQIKEEWESLKECLASYKENLLWFAGKFQEPGQILSLTFERLRERLLACSNDLASLETWIDYSASRKRINELGLGDYLTLIEDKPIASGSIVPIFVKRFFRLWLDSVYPEYPSVAKFRHSKHEAIIKDFVELDKEQMTIARVRIVACILNSLPPLDTFTSGEVNVLKRELAKQRKIMPIRKLFSRIPNLLMTLKPCLMMSPLSVSTFLESDDYQFDTVIFDEASQVKTENAVGAIFRGKQIIIAGDSHQLPPTNFFNVQSNDSDFDTEEEEENESLDQSILEEALFLPSRELLWHYRSRHEHLIAFSNAKIYKNRLVTFPSNTERAPGWGVEYIYVEGGSYNSKGKAKGNSLEASRVAQEVFRHIREYPHRTLGVITFGIVQELAIESAINKLRKENPQYEDFFMEDKHEAFFVKSLENVQGDERDTIIFSIGYAKDAEGKMSMRFGPLSVTGGERRLNVAITRAKYNIKLIGSILPTDIDTERVSQEGPKLLKKYIEFAMNGPEGLLSEGSEGAGDKGESPFEDSVRRFLEEKGYKLVTQVGCAGYRIDLGVKHPRYSGIFVLGIECDGVTYRSSRTARERDRLRQTVLENMGWRIYRIWSTDWIKDTASEKTRLLKAIEEAITDFKIERYKNPKIELPLKEPQESEVLIQFEDKEVEEENYGFEDYKAAQVEGRVEEKDYALLSMFVKDVVEAEAPVHFDVVCQRVCKLLGRQKVTSVVQGAVKGALTYLKGKIEEKDDFFYLMEDPAPDRVRKAGPRQVKYIALDELATGMCKVIENNIGLTVEELVKESSKAFGFTKSGNNIAERMDDAVHFLTENKVVEIRDGKVFLLRENDE